ncbi:MAG: hypothetical protein U0790_24165 [Isosphaeraceae bacterium]
MASRWNGDRRDRPPRRRSKLTWLGHAFQDDPAGTALRVQAPEQAFHRAGQLAVGEVAEVEQQLGHLLLGPGGVPLAAEPPLDAADRLGVKQPPGARGLEQGVEQVLVHRRAPRAEVSPTGLVPLVEIGRRELEDQVGGEGEAILPVACRTIFTSPAATSK